MSAVHDIFHVSQLKKCLQVPDQVIDFGDVELEPDLTYASKTYNQVLQSTMESTH